MRNRPAISSWPKAIFSMRNITSASCPPPRPTTSRASSSTAVRTRSSTTRNWKISPESASVEQRGGQQASDPDGLGDQPMIEGGERPQQQPQQGQQPYRQQRDYRDNRDSGQRDQGQRDQGQRDQGRDQRSDRDQNAQPNQSRDRFKPRWQDRKPEGQQGQPGEPRQNYQPQPRQDQPPGHAASRRVKTRAMTNSRVSSRPIQPRHRRACTCCSRRSAVGGAVLPAPAGPRTRRRGRRSSGTRSCC